MIKRLVIVLVVLAAVVVGGDRLTSYVASNAAADAIAKQGAQGTHVVIHGVPFLTQAIGGDLDHVSVRANSVTKDGVTVSDIRAEAYGVHVDAGDAVSGRVRSVPVDRVAGSAVITYATLTSTVVQKVGLPGSVGLTFTPRDQDDLTVTATGPFGLKLSGDLPVPTVSDGKLQLGGLAQRFAPLLPDQAAEKLAIPLPDLPYGLRLSGARAESDGLHFSLVGRDVDLG